MATFNKNELVAAIKSGDAKLVESILKHHPSHINDDLGVSDDLDKLLLKAILWYHIVYFISSRWVIHLWF